MKGLNLKCIYINTNVHIIAMLVKYTSAGKCMVYVNCVQDTERPKTYCTYRAIYTGKKSTEHFCIFAKIWQKYNNKNPMIFPV